MRVIGLDLSLTATGVSTAEGTLTISFKKVRGMERLHGIRNAIHVEVDVEREHGPVLVMIEDYAFSRHDAHAHALGELGGVIRLLLWEMEIPYVDVKAQTIKMYATGKGNAGKDEVLVQTVRRYPDCDVENNNEADAFQLRAIGLAKLGDPLIDLPATHTRALEKVRLPDTMEGYLHTSP